MKDLFLDRQVTSVNDQDLWAFRLGSKRLTMAYPMGFELLNGILLACKQAMQYEAVSPLRWLQFAKLNSTKNFIATTGTHRGFRRSLKVPNVKAWEAFVEGPLVVLEFYPHEGSETLVAKIHYADMFSIYSSARIACKNAKAWAGDSSRIWNGRAHLSTVEENAKLKAVS